MLLSLRSFMLLSFLSSFLLLSLANAEPKVVSMQTTRMSRSSLQKRNTGSFGIDNGLLLYTINATIGTPPQSVVFAVDTSSGDTYVLDSTLVNDHTQPSDLFASCK
jgi:hypothetical protein